MERQLKLPIYNLDDKKLEFVQAWELDSQAKLLEGTGLFAPVNVWQGKFIEGETVVIATSADEELKHVIGRSSVGVVLERDYVNADDPLEFVVAEATHITGRGVIGALELLIKMTGPRKV